MPAAASAPLPQPIFSEPIFSEDGSLRGPNGYATDHPDNKQALQQVNALQQTKVVEVPPSRVAPDQIYSLAEAYGTQGEQVTDFIRSTGHIVFHTLGDSGASKDGGHHPDELRVAEQVTSDAGTSAPDSSPAFLFHLGDVVYYFGEAESYYEQFYDPYRNYPAPIFAIPGNHDSNVRPGTPPGQEPLVTFQRNFCSPQIVIASDASPLHRTAGTQPGIYFTLDAPFVRIIALFSNALGDPGVISNLDGQWPRVSNIQIEFLRAQLQRIKQEDYQGAVLLAVHHPPFTYQPKPEEGGKGGNHFPNPVMLGQIDTVCKDVGVYPHAFLSGHSHNYQRYTRILDFGGSEITVPFIVCGDGGHAVDPLIRASGGHTPPQPQPNADVIHLDKQLALPVKRLVLAKYDSEHYGYLRIQVDKEYLKIGFHQGGAALPQSRYDMVTVRLRDHHLVAN